MAGKFEIYEDKAGEYRFRLKAGNGEIILASEGYKQKASCENGVASVKKMPPKTRGTSARKPSRANICST